MPEPEGLNPNDLGGDRSLTEEIKKDGVSIKKELASWWAPKKIETAPIPELRSQAPSLPKLPMPAADGKPTIVTFLRHCGCPFAEKTFRRLRKLASKNPDVHFIAVSHSDAPSTDKWVISVGGTWEAEVIVDYEREIYAAWGLGISSTWHVLNPWSLGAVYSLGKQEGIWNRPTESGSRWQMGGSFAVDGKGKVRWIRVAKAADEVPDFMEALKTISAAATETADANAAPPVLPTRPTAGE